MSHGENITRHAQTTYDRLVEGLSATWDATEVRVRRDKEMNWDEIQEKPWIYRLVGTNTSAAVVVVKKNETYRVQCGHIVRLGEEEGRKYRFFPAFEDQS